MKLLIYIKPMFKLFKPIYFQIFKKEKYSTAFHEAGHGIVSAIFKDKLKLKCLTVNEELLKKIDPTYRGGLHIEWDTTPLSTQFESADHLILIAWAGMCAKTIHEKGINYSQRNLRIFKHNGQTMLACEGAGVDYEIIKDHALGIAQFIKVRPIIIQWSAFLWVMEYLMKDEVWKATKKLAKEIIRSHDETMHEAEINNFLKQIGFMDYLNNNKQRQLSKRYPLNSRNMDY